MTQIQQTGVGQTATPTSLIDTDGTGLLPVQVAVEGTATYRLLARVSTQAPWVELRPAASDGFLEAISWVPYLALEVTAGAGTVRLWVADK